MSYRAVSIRSSARRARGHAGSRAVQWSCSPSAVGANAEAYPGLPSAPGGSGLLGPHCCSRLVVPFAVDGVNLRLLLWPFSSVSLTFCAGIVTISLFFFFEGEWWWCVYIWCSDMSGKCKKTSLPAKTIAEPRCVIQKGLYFRRESSTVTISCVF